MPFHDHYLLVCDEVCTLLRDLVEPLKSVHTWVNLGTKLESCKVSIPDIPFATTVACVSHDVARLYFNFFSVETTIQHNHRGYWGASPGKTSNSRRYVLDFNYTWRGDGHRFNSHG